MIIKIVDKEIIHVKTHFIEWHSKFENHLTEERVELYNLGRVPWEESQLIYHALALMGRESLVILSPASPYVCIGYHQNVNHEVDVDYCRRNDVPLFRREVGGGAVYLDGNQLFFQIILSKSNPAVPQSRNRFYEKFLQPAIDVYRRIGIAAEYKPVNDIIVADRKISGTGAGEIGDSIAFVGNLILDFDYAMMARVLNVPDEKFRDKVRKSIEENLTTIRRELEDADRWDEQRLSDLLLEEFDRLLGPLQPHERDDDLNRTVEELRSKMMSDDWLYRKGRALSGVRIRSGVNLMHRMYKAPGGLIRADYEIRDGRLYSVSLSGDFFCYPESAIVELESKLEGVSPSEVKDIIADFYRMEKFEIPAVEVDDWMMILKG